MRLMINQNFLLSITLIAVLNRYVTCSSVINYTETVDNVTNIDNRTIKEEVSLNETGFDPAQVVRTLDGYFMQFKGTVRGMLKEMQPEAQDTFLNVGTWLLTVAILVVVSVAVGCYLVPLMAYTIVRCTTCTVCGACTSPTPTNFN